MGVFDQIEQDGTRIISGSLAAACWIYGVFETGEVFYFTCDRRSATLSVLVRDFERPFPGSHDWQIDREVAEITSGVAMWPSEQEVADHFSRLKHEFQQSALMGIARPMSEEQYVLLRSNELRDMMS